MDDGDAAHGARLPHLTQGPILRHHLVEWCAAENDYYNIHYDERAAQAMGLVGAPIQGTYKFALLGEMVREWLGARGRILKISARYQKPDFEGGTLRCGGLVTANEGSNMLLDLFVENETGERTTVGKAVVNLFDPESVPAPS